MTTVGEVGGSAPVTLLLSVRGFLGVRHPWAASYYDSYTPPDMLVPSAPAEEKFSAAGADGRVFSCRFPDPVMIVSLGDQRLVGCIGCLVGPGGGLDHRLDCDGAGRHL